ncbi:MAG: ribosome maturation factor RimP [Clostridia bacterium]|nr:ribosome maturation factor RimP [Clostridia bacterium]
MASQNKGGNTVERCRALVQPSVESLGLSLWDVRFVKEGATWYLRFFIDKEGGVDINDCVALTRLINPLLDEADPISQSYTLEVCSPGLERELTRPEHFAQCQGEAVVVTLIRPREGEREFAGILVRGDNNQIAITLEDKSEQVFEKKDVSSVRLLADWDNEEV